MHDNFGGVWVKMKIFEMRLLPIKKSDKNKREVYHQLYFEILDNLI